MKKLLLIFILLLSIAFCREIQNRPDIRPLANKDIVLIVRGFSRTHHGIDYACYLDTEIHATGSGKVIKARFIRGYGNCIIIQHSWKDSKGKQKTAYSLYAHLVEFKVIKGQRVSKRQVIGLAGSTGRSEGVHLHYELRNYKNYAIWNGTYQAQNKREGI